MDGDGLRLVIDAKGRGYWVLRVMVGGKDHERSLGRADELPLSEAREKGRAARAELMLKAAPASTARQVPTFAEAARLHHDVVAPTLRNVKHAAQWITTL